ncbi:MAG TPA: glycoside hydrolase family 3 C-terminal domain-containing protein [Bryobacteraceae bacterium]|jgi:beta-glucosidase|nr:glycoside hydrolase family 3 C-terminal domain-containing protein [Bryobacteraceae bacterium]
MRTMLLAVLLALLAAASLTAQTTSGWKLIWNDEFNAPAGTLPNPANWNYDLGNNGGWGNGEAEVYTNSPNNVFQDGKGNLVIRAIRDSSGNFTSARLQTGAPGASTQTTDLSWQFGRVEARIKLPFGQGVWPAFWMLGENIGTVSWPQCGEVDIMENFGTFNNNLSINNGTAHGPGYSGGNGITAAYTLPLGETVSDDFHVYAIEWSQNSIEFFVDGASYHHVTPASLPTGTQWVFNNPFFILLNLAIGGPNTFLGTPDPNAPFPDQEMLVDYVRVYQPAGITTATPVITPSGVVNAASYLGEISPGSLASVYGNNFANANVTDHPPAAPDFPTKFDNVTVSVDGVSAPLVYVSATQINFQVPWETKPGLAVNIKVTRNGVDSNIEPVTIAAAASPSMFLNDFTNGIAWVTGAGCTGECAVTAGMQYQLWANGLGPKNSPQLDGVPAVSTGSLKSLEVPGSPASCRLTIGGQSAVVDYCGAAPGLIIDQVNFTYPSGISTTAPYVDATLTIGGATGRFRLPTPAAATSDQRADQLLAQMTLDEKFQLVAGAGGPVTNIPTLPRGAGGFIPGVPRLGIPDLYFSDGSVGVANGQAPATALPSSIASAASWDLDLAYQYGTVIGAEMRAYGLNVNLGGNTNLIGREPRDGRTFETKGEDPLLAGSISAAHIRGTQDQHIIGGLKHFAFNDQETGRTFANVEIDERGGRESDWLAFEIALDESNVQSVMCSYNLINGVYACENPHSLTDVLKGDWGFQGFVMSDWWATHSTVAAALAGLDQEQPDSAFFSNLPQAVADGQVPQSRIDDMVHRVLRAMFEVGLMDHPESLGPVDTVTDQAVAQKVEEQGAVLLKNSLGQLPLNASTVGSIAVIGSHADVAVISGGGSAQVHPTGGPALTEGYPCQPCWAQVIWDPSSPLKAIQATAPNATVKFDPGTNAASATSLAASSSVAIVFVSQWASEGMDLPSLNFTDVIHSTPIDQDALVAAIAAANPHTIVVMENGGAQVMPWLGAVSAVLEAWFPGQRGGEAIANILFGAVNPSGKLPITFPASVSDLPHPEIAGSPNVSTPFPVAYSEGLLVGYKWYDAKHITPAFPFGFGLSYATFSFSNFNVVNSQVTFDVVNTGSVSGAEVAQVYVALPASTGEPPKRLVGWQKVFLQPGAQQHVAIGISANDPSHPLSWWDVTSSSWQTAAGDYPVYVGNSSSAANLTLAGTIHVGS